MRKKKGGILPSPFKFAKHGQSGIEVSELFPEVAACIDDICVIRSMYTDNPNHEPSLLMMNSGNMQPIRPSLGSWLTFGLGSENQNLPGFVVLCPGKPVVGPQLWGNSFLPGVYQGTHINNKTVDPERIIRDIRNRHLSPAAQREQVDLLQRLNRRHLGGARPRRAAGGPDRVAGDRLPHAVRGPRRLRHRQGVGRDPRPLRRGRVRRRLPDRPPPGRARGPRDAGLLRRRPALGRPRATSSTTATTPRRATAPSRPC